MNYDTCEECKTLETRLDRGHRLGCPEQTQAILAHQLLAEHRAYIRHSAKDWNGVKQAEFWHGKWAIVKLENNKLRYKYREANALLNVVELQAQEILQLRALLV